MGEGAWRSRLDKPPLARPAYDAADPRCSFCAKGKDVVRNLIVGPAAAVAICNECVELCSDINAERDRDASAST